eukprot:747751-Hanusia_phi.AAC.4
MSQRDFPYYHVEQTVRLDLSRELLLGVMSTGLRLVKLGLYDPVSSLPLLSLPSPPHSSSRWFSSFTCSYLLPLSAPLPPPSSSITPFSSSCSSNPVRSPLRVVLVAAPGSCSLNRRASKKRLPSTPSTRSTAGERRTWRPLSSGQLSWGGARF